MEEKLKEMTIKDEDMEDFVYETNKDSTNGDIFIFIRNLQEEVKKQNIKITNISHLYWFLIDFRDKSQVA